MAIWMWILIIFIIFQRFVELVIARRNEKWMKDRGGIERGQEHYKWFILLHVAFFVSIISEVALRGVINPGLNYLLLSVFIIAQVGRIWCIYTLGKFWNTKVIVLPGGPLVTKGPYKYVKHPNYIIVGVELFIIPLLFGDYITACIFPLLHILLLKIRIPKENRALVNITTSKL